MSWRFTIRILLSIAAPTALWSADQPTTPLPTFVFAGQSNMVGKRCRADELSAALRVPNENALFFDARKKTWIPIAPGRTEPSGFGPEITFAAAMTANRKGKIGLIKLSRGGSNLAQHWMGNSHESLYNRLLRIVSDARKTRPIETIGMFWVQGGADAKTKEMATAYADNLKRLITSARTDFGNPNMFFISGRIPAKDDITKPHWPLVRQAQQDLQMKNYAWINCDDLTLFKDRVHYDTAGMAMLGRRLATEFTRFPLR